MMDFIEGNFLAIEVICFVNSVFETKESTINNGNSKRVILCIFLYIFECRSYQDNSRICVSIQKERKIAWYDDAT